MTISILPQIIQAKPLKELSTFKIGGPAYFFAEAKTKEELQALIVHAKEKQIPVLVIGKGSNCLFNDKGFDGLVILNKIDFISDISEEVTVGAGFSFALLGVKTARAGFSGLEFASGIPASVGGAVFMNAGANGQEVKDCLESVEFFDEDGRKQHFTNTQMQYSYRHSIFHGQKGYIVAATFKLIPAAEARAKQIEIVRYRQSTQPYSEPSVGCIFRNPTPTEGCCISAGALIEQAGLKGTKVGGAMVSEKHANFIVNAGNATALDVCRLIEIVKEKVFAHSKVMLEEEVRKIGFEG